MSKIKIQFTDLAYTMYRPDLQHFQTRKIARESNVS